MLTFGIEEEYFITDLHSRQMVGEPSAAVLAACREAISAGFSFEMFQGQIEAASPVFTSSAEAADYFRAVRGNLAQSLAEFGLGVVCAGSHPLADWRGQRPTDQAHFRHLFDDIQYVARRSVLCGLHVHVQVPQALDRIAVMNQVSLVAIVASSMAVPDAPMHQSHQASSPLADILAQPGVRALLAAGLCMQAAHGAMNIFYSIYIAGLGYSKSVVGGLFSLGVVAEIAMFFFMSSVMRRYSLRRILIASFAVAVGRFLLIGWCANLPVQIFAQTLHSLTFGAFHAASIAAINHWFRGSARARGQALYSSVAFGAGGLLGGLVSGWSWDHLGGAMAFTLSSLFALVGLVFVVKWVKMGDADEPTGMNAVDTNPDRSRG